MTRPDVRSFHGRSEGHGPVGEVRAASRWCRDASLFGLLSSAFGLVLILLAQFGAAFKRDEPQYNAEMLVVLGLGVIIIVVAIRAVLRPSKPNAIVAEAALVAAPVVGRYI